MKEWKLTKPFWKYQKNIKLPREISLNHDNVHLSTGDTLLKFGEEIQCDLMHQPWAKSDSSFLKGQKDTLLS